MSMWGTMLYKPPAMHGLPCQLLQVCGCALVVPRLAASLLLCWKDSGKMLERTKTAVKHCIPDGRMLLGQ